MPDGPGRFTQNSSCSALLRILPENTELARTGLSPSAGGLSRPFRFASRSRVAVLQPRQRRNAAGLGFSPFARHYWGNHSCFLFLQVLRCFSSLRSPHHSGDSRPSGGWVVPFGNPRIKGYLLLPAAYRSLSRPSSPPRAQASTMCPFLLPADPLTLSAAGKRGDGSIYIRLFDFCSTLNFSACTQCQ